MLKKVLIGAAVASALASGAASAKVTISGDDITISKQGAASVEAMTPPAVTITLGAEYKVDDLVEIGYSVPFAAKSEVPASLTVDLCPDAVAGSGTMTLGFLETSEMAATYRVTDISYADAFGGDEACDSTIGGELTFGGAMSGTLLSVPAVLAAGNVDVTYEARIDGGAFTLDGGAQTKKGQDKGTYLVTVVDQYSLGTVTPFDGIINVQAEPSRTVFTTGAADSLAVQVKKAAVTDVVGFSATAETVEITVSGDFSFAKDGVADFSVAEAGATLALAADKKSIKITADAGAALAGGSATYTLTYTNNEDSVMSPGDYEASVTVKYAEADDADPEKATQDSVTFATASAGEFTLNGSSTRFPSYFYGYPNVASAVWVNNSGDQNGDVTIEGYDKNGTAFGPMVITTSSATSIQPIASQINRALLALGVAPGRVDLTVTINAPDDEIVIDAYFNVGGSDRVRYDDDSIRSRLDAIEAK